MVEKLRETIADAFNMLAPLRVVVWAAIIIATMIGAFGLLVFATQVRAKDHGQFGAIDPQRKAWFEKLVNQHGGQCCADADGETLADVDWELVNDSAKPVIHFRVRLLDHWIDVPDDTVITTPNLYERTIVWPIYAHSKIEIRCFIPGSMS